MIVFGTNHPKNKLVARALIGMRKVEVVMSYHSNKFLPAIFNHEGVPHTDKIHKAHTMKIPMEVMTTALCLLIGCLR